MNRRDFLKLPIVVAPWVITTPGLLMPIKQLWTPPPYDPFQDIDVIVGGRILIATPDNQQVMAVVLPGPTFVLLDRNGKPMSDRVSYTGIGSDGIIRGTMICDPAGRIRCSK